MPLLLLLLLFLPHLASGRCAAGADQELVLNLLELRDGEVVMVVGEKGASRIR